MSILDDSLFHAALRQAGNPGEMFYEGNLVDLLAAR
jgi:hypothetical protein